MFTKTALLFIFENAPLLNIPVCRKKRCINGYMSQMRWQTHHNCFRNTGEYMIFFQMEKYQVLYLECRSCIGDIPIFNPYSPPPARKKCMLPRSHFLTAPVCKKKLPKGFFAPVYHFYIDHKQVVYPPIFCITNVSKFAWLLRSSQEKLNTMVIQNFEG